MKNTIFALIFSLILVSCGQKSVDTAKVDVKPAVETKSVDVSMSTPELFGGPGGFGLAFMGSIQTQNFDWILKFTSKESIDKLGVDAVLAKYKSLKIDYKLKLVSSDKGDKYTTLRYKTNEYATSKFKDFVVVVENDSCKLVLPENIDDFLK